MTIAFILLPIGIVVEPSINLFYSLNHFQSEKLLELIRFRTVCESIEKAKAVLRILEKTLVPT
jgi:hypothetical protein